MVEKSGSSLKQGFDELNGVWNYSYEMLNGISGSIFTIKDGHPKSLDVSASVDGGRLDLTVQQAQLNQDPIIKNITLQKGKQTICLKDFYDGNVSVSISGFYAENVDVKMKYAV